jgi:hypothetical protein
MVDAILILSNDPALGAHGDPQTQRALTWGSRRTPRLEQENPIGWRVGMFLGSEKARGVRSIWLARNCLRVLRLVHCVEHEQLEETLHKLENFERENSDIFSSRSGFN